MVDEMLKLRKLLTMNGIEWHDASEIPDFPLQVDRTLFDFRGYKWSVINGHGTYGGFGILSDKNMGLLELTSEAVNGGEPFGFLTADQVMQLVFYPKQTFSGLVALDQITPTFDQMIAKELKLIISSNNARKMRHEPMYRRLTGSRHRRMKRTQPKQGKLRNRRHEFT